MLNIDNIRKHFPLIQQHPELAYLDNAATTQKPRVVIDALVNYYTNINANIHRSPHKLGAAATAAYEGARETVRNFIGAAKTEEIVFTKGATEAVNLVAQSFVRPRLQAGDNVVISIMEHHANFVPWQMLCAERGAELRIIPVDEAGELDLNQLDSLLDERTKMLAVVHISNTLGTINPIKNIIQKAHKKDIPVLIDAAQSIAHYPIDVQQLNCDFLVFSGHKVYAPTGIGVLYVKESILKNMQPYQYGGDMILSVTLEGTTFNKLPYRFEAGTPPIAEAIGLAKALDFVRDVGQVAIQAHVHQLLDYATAQLSKIEGLRIVGQAAEKSGILSFTLDNAHPHDIATLLDQSHIAIRAGHHCTQPLMTHFGISGTARASFSMYNTVEEVDRLVEGVLGVVEMFS